MTSPDPKTVREIAREFLLDDSLGPDELNYVVRSHTGYTFPEEDFQAWRDAVDADVQNATVTKTASWPDEQATTGRPAADLAHAAEDLREHLALRARAVNDEVLRSPEVISVARADGHSHALMETVLRTLLAERDALAAYVDRLAAPDDEAVHAAAMLRDWFKSEGSLVMDEEDLGHVQTVLTDYERITAAPQYFVDGQPVDRESYEAWVNEGRETDYDEAGIYYDEHDDDENGGPF